MGHTVASQRIVIDLTMNELKNYAKALREEDRKVFFELIREPYKKIGAISYANSMHVWAFILLAIIEEQEKRIRKLEEMYTDSNLDNK